MAFEISKSFDILEKSLYYRKIRQDMIASNIANADTPYYRPKDIRFEEALEKEVNQKFGIKDKTLQLAVTNPRHLEPKNLSDSTKPIVFFRDGHLARNDGNSVDIDVEMSEMAKNNMAYNASIAALRKDIELFKAVIDSTRNL
ncbi:flagellar basal body rod protein FlgB [Caminibacter pacificus]